MMFEVYCVYCGTNNYFDPQTIINKQHIRVICSLCGNPIHVSATSVTEYNAEINTKPILPVLEEGTIVEITNREHVWYGEIGLICDRKHKHYRIEVFGRKVWMPEHWVKSIDERNDSDQ